MKFTVKCCNRIAWAQSSATCDGCTGLAIYVVRRKSRKTRTPEFVASYFWLDPFSRFDIDQASGGQTDRQTDRQTERVCDETEEALWCAHPWTCRRRRCYVCLVWLINDCNTWSHGFDQPRWRLLFSTSFRQLLMQITNTLLSLPHSLIWRT